MFLHDIAHLVLPPNTRRLLRYEQVVCAGGNRGHQTEPATMSAHDLNDKATLMGCCSVEDIVYCRTDSLERRVATDCRVSARHVVVNRANKSDDVEVREWRCLFLGEFAGFHK